MGGEGGGGGGNAGRSGNRGMHVGEHDTTSSSIGMSPGRSQAEFGHIGHAGKSVGDARADEGRARSGVATTTAKQEEFGRKAGVTGTTSLRAGKTMGLSPGDINAIMGTTQTQGVKSGLEGIAGITTENLGQLQSRATVGQLAGVPTPVGQLANQFSKQMAQNIIEGISTGKQAVFDRSTNSIVGYVSQNALGMDVYTGRSEFNPLGRKTGVTRIGKGFSLGADRGPDGDGRSTMVENVSAPTEETAPATTTPTPSAAPSQATRRSMLASRQSGAARRLFIR